jgi:hypothetical protein
MKVWIFVAACAAAVALLSSQSANAGSVKRTDPRIVATSIGVGAATTAGYFALRDWKFNYEGRVNGLSRGGAFAVTTAGCLALSPIVGTVAVQRELTFREAYGLLADCVVPFVGAWLVNKAFDAHPEWERKPVRKRVAKR